MKDVLVSVIMPIRNEAAFIEQSLGAVLKQVYPADRLEIIVVDGMSTDATVEIIRALPGAERVRVLHNPARNQAAGMNLGIRQARGEIIVRVDGHTIIAPDYVQACVDALRESGADNVGGMMIPVGVTPTGKMIAAANTSPFAVPSAFRTSQKAQFTDTVYLGAWRRDLFERIGCYTEEAVPNEDYELNYRIRKAGGSIYLTQQIRSCYYGRQHLADLARQYFRYGIGKVKTLTLHPESVRVRQLVAPVFAAGLIGGALLAVLHPLLTALWIAGLGVYGALNLYFTFRLMMAASVAAMWKVPAIFLLIHLCWGVGFWVGLTQQIASRISLPEHPIEQPVDRLDAERSAEKEVRVTL